MAEQNATPLSAAVTLTPILQKREAEMEELQNRITAISKEMHDMKPVVDEYNAKAKWRKDLRRELAAKQRTLKAVASFFNGLSIFDERFPLFSKQPIGTQPQS